MAAKFTPVPAMRPTPSVVPCRSVRRKTLAGFCAAAARSTMLVPPTGLTKLPTGTVPPCENAAQFTPSSALLLTSTSTMIASTSTCGWRMSSLSMTAISARMILGGAVMTSALFAGSAQIMAFFSACASGEAAAPAAPPALPPVAAAMPVICSLSFGGDLFGVRVAQVAHPRVAAALERRIQVRDQRLDAQPLRLLAADQDAVGALVGDDLDGRAFRWRPRPGRGS